MTAEKPCKRLELSLGVVRGDVELCVDAARGEVSASGHLAFKNSLTDQWHTVLKVAGEVLIRYGRREGPSAGIRRRIRRSWTAPSSRPRGLRRSKPRACGA